ncbi:low-density lipoprotein receptor domain class A domain-containing protein [Phthorimaea operculella]|nr:low-density lipoprotein receptor domain class A domain-containing protein [Phthorimaea operculella]
MARGNGSCIPRDWICDGSKDCPAGEDEKNCSPCEKNQYHALPCFRREMACGDGSCIPRDWICDGSKDCPPGEDENNC